MYLESFCSTRILALRAAADEEFRLCDEILVAAASCGDDNENVAG